MDTFLRQVARRIADTHPHDTDRVLVVMNNRRSLRFFQRQFNGLGRPLFLPKTMVIDDLVAELGGLEVVPNEFLLFELYRIHTEIGGEERKYKTFDEFISFGDLMLSDFSELDQYCVDARDLFGNLHDLKGIGEWDIEGAELSPFQRDYLTFYRSLYEYYRRLHERLLAQGKAYSGMAYRQVAEHIGDLLDLTSQPNPDHLTLNTIPWEAVYFVGFNAISECERRIIGEYVRRGIGHLLTDGDPYFLAPEQEAGHFLRKHMAEFPEIAPAGPSLFGQGQRRITVVECPENVLQCKYAGQLLSRHPEWLDGAEGESTAVVLADESLMLPCLNSLPDADSEGRPYSVNISMGYAYTDSNIHLTAQKLLALHRNRNRRGYYCGDVLEVLSDAFVGRLLGQPDLRHRAARFLEQGNYIRCRPAELADFLCSPQTALLFPDEPLDPDGWIATMQRMLAALVAGGWLESNKKEKQAAASLAEILDYMAGLQSTYHYIEDFTTLEKIYSRIGRRHAIALIGEPLSGLQLLGVLETRNLDFKRVVLLSANEGMIPSGRGGNTLIPHELKRAFGLPTYQEKDSVYAYNFYHLLLRAEEVYLVFNSESEAMGKGEPSRFIRQVESELAPRFGIEVRHLVVNNNEPPKEALPDPVGTKDEAVMQRLRALAEKGFTPTGFDDYLECPLRYYYSRVLRIEKEETLEDDLDASQLGTCIHNTLEHIYAPYVGRQVDVDGLRQALADLPELMDREFRELYLHGRDTEGRNHFFRSVAETQLRNLLQKEISVLRQGHRLDIVAVEQPMEPLLLGHDNADTPIRLRGKVDRIDLLDGQLRVIDYKTGHLKENEIAFRSTPNRSGVVTMPGKWFQLMCYALLYARSPQNTEHLSTLHVGIYPLRNLQSDVRLASWDGETAVSAAMLDDFEERLRRICLELLDPATPFHGSNARDHCRYCDVRLFCPLRP